MKRLVVREKGLWVDKGCRSKKSLRVDWFAGRTGNHLDKGTLHSRLLKLNMLLIVAVSAAAEEVVYLLSLHAGFRFPRRGPTQGW